MIHSTRHLFSRRWPRILAGTCSLALLTVAPALPAVHAAPEAPAAVVLDPTDATALRPHVGEQVTVRGAITSSGHGKSDNVAYLNFAGPHKGLSLVFFLKLGVTGKAASEDDLKPFIGKTVTVSGKLMDYKGDLEIIVESLDLMKVTP